MTQRTAVGVIPATPATLAGASGLALTSRFMPATPQPVRSVATALPYVQPELSGVVRVGRHLAFSGRTTFAPGGLPFQPVSGPGVPADSLSLESTIGMGAELPIGDHFGLLGAAEVGLVFASLNIRDVTFSTRSVETWVLPTIRGAGGFFLTFGPARLFLAAEGGDTLVNDAESVRTLSLGVSSDTGSVGSQSLFLFGGGVRVMLGKYVSLAAEGWAGGLADGRMIPFIGALTLRVFSFDVPVFGKPPPPVVEPPPPPAWEEPPPTSQPSAPL
jgi:hypothetical protein